MPPVFTTSWRLGVLAFISLCLLVFALGASRLDDDAVWGDEYYSIFDAGGADYGPLTPAGIWGRVAERNPWHAPGFFILLSGWGRLVGWEPFALRTLALLVGVLAVAWMYRLGADTVSPRVGLLAAVLLGTSAFFLYYTHELRMYTLIALLTVVTVWCYLRLLHDSRPLLWVGLFGGAVGLLYVHYFAALTLGAIGVYHLLVRPKDRRWWLIVGVLIAAGLLFLPWLRVLLDAVSRAAAAETLQARALNPGETLAALALLTSNGAVLLLAVTLALAGWPLSARFLRHRGQTDRRRGDARIAPTQSAATEPSGEGIATLIILAVTLILLVLAANAILKVMHAGRLRYLMVPLPLVLLVCAVGIDRLTRWRRELGALLLAAWLITGASAILRGDVTADLDGSIYTAPLHHIERALTGRAQPGDFVVVFPPANLPTWRYRVAGDFYLGDLGDGYTIVNVLNDSDEPVDDPAALAAGLRERDRVWLAYSPGDQPPTLAPFQDGMDAALNQCTTLTPADAVTVTLYAASPVCCVATPSEADALMTFGDGIALTGFTPPPDTVTDMLTLRLGWAVAPTVPPNMYSVGLHLVDEAGALVAQTDVGLPAGTFTCAPQTLDVSGVAPGDYTLLLTVYDWQTGAALPGRDLTSGQTGPRLPLAPLTVAR